ncbi:ABC transporter permease [Tistrella mobilis]|uniref:ABC transporter permease n=1 Tax=Tistrella mobilis TaxID=171437 RepID=UPI0035586690
MSAETASPTLLPIPTLAPTLARPLITFDRVSRRFGGAQGVTALDDVSLSIHRGEMVAIVGASGSGKSTLMNILGCLDRPSGGRLLIDGQDVSALDTDALAALRNRRFGFVFQRYNLLHGLSAAENVEMPAIYAGRPAEERRRAAHRLLGRLGLQDRAGHRPSELSGGQQQRVSIARALVNDADIILADEPTGALDEAAGAEVLALLDDLHAEGRTIIIVTHDPTVAAHAGRRIRIRDGRVVADEGDGRRGSPAAAEAAPCRPGRSGPVRLLGDVASAGRMAFRSLAINPLRTLLTLLGVVIGVASVIAMLAIGDGGREATLRRIAEMGTNLITVRAGAPGIRSLADLTSLTIGDIEALSEIRGLAAISPERNLRTTLRVGNRDYTTMAQGVWPDLLVARSRQLAAGSFFTRDDIRSYAAVMVLGQSVADILFPGQDPIGRQVLAGRVPFEVIGVLAPRGVSGGGTDQDDVVLIPLSSGFMRLLGRSHVSSVTLKVADAGDMERVADEIDRILFDRHHIRNYQIRSSTAAQIIMSDSQRSFALLLGAVAAISLVVGGIGVMNIMLVGVTERTREIGIRMATGARRRDVLIQFNVEAIAVCGLGGVIGVGLGLGSAVWLGRLGFDVLITPMPAVMAFSCAFLTGLVFGWLPARKAAGMDPVRALAAG